MTEKEDYLEVDTAIPGQNYVCLSFISPETIMESKDAFKVSKFLQSYCKEQKLDLKDVMKKYTDYIYKYEEELQKDFDEQNKFQTNIRGLKVRGTYSTREEAEKRAKTLQSIDSEFHVFVGQVGYWLPWDPCADKVADEHYINDQLNEMMEKYKENNINRDIFYEEEKREKVKAAKEEALRKKKEDLLEKSNNTDTTDSESKEAPKKVQEILDNGGDNIGDVKEEGENVVGDVKEEGENVVGDVKEVVDNILSESMKQSLDDIDPWMSRRE